MVRMRMNESKYFQKYSYENLLEIISRHTEYSFEFVPKCLQGIAQILFSIDPANV